MKVLITGGAGYIGSHTNVYFASKGADTVILDDLCEGHEQAVACGRLIKGSVGDKPLLDKLFREEKFDAIIHFAAFASVADSVARPSRYYLNNVCQMRTLLDAAVENGVKAVVFSSSAAVFGEPVYVPIDEKHPLLPINPYGFTKLAGEQMLKDYERAYGLRWCAFRYFNAAGCAADASIGEAHEPETHLIPLLLRAARTGQPMNIYGTDYPTRDGSCLRDYVHVMDLASAHWLGMTRLLNGGSCEAFNLGSGEGFTVLEMLAACEEVTGLNIPHSIEARRSGDPAALIASSQKAKNELGWNSDLSSIEKMIADAWEWEKKRAF